MRSIHVAFPVHIKDPFMLKCVYLLLEILRIVERVEDAEQRLS